MKTAKVLLFMVVLFSLSSAYADTDFNFDSSSVQQVLNQNDDGSQTGSDDEDTGD